MSDNEEFPRYSNEGTQNDPITRAEYNARKKMCAKCLKPWSAQRNTIMREDLGVIGTGAGIGAMMGWPPGAAVGAACGWFGYLITPVRYTCKHCGASFCVNKWL